MYNKEILMQMWIPLAGKRVRMKTLKELEATPGIERVGDSAHNIIGNIPGLSRSTLDGSNRINISPKYFDGREIQLGIHHDSFIYFCNTDLGLYVLPVYITPVRNIKLYIE